MKIRLVLNLALGGILLGGSMAAFADHHNYFGADAKAQAKVDATAEVTAPAVSEPAMHDADNRVMGPVGEPAVRDVDIHMHEGTMDTSTKHDKVDKVIKKDKFSRATPSRDFVYGRNV